MGSSGYVGYVDVICGECGEPRTLRKDYARDLARKAKPNVCRRCIQKKASYISKMKAAAAKQKSVAYACPECGTVRYLLPKTLQQYRSKGIKPRCQGCANTRNARRKAQKERTGEFDHVVPRPGWHRCLEGLTGEAECGRYEDCLTYAAKMHFAGFTCSIHGGGYFYSDPAGPDEDVLRTALEASIEADGWIPEQTQALVLR